MSGFPIDLPSELYRKARGIAFAVLHEHARTDAFVGDLLDRAFREHDVPPGERGLATALANGVVRRQDTLDAIVAAHVTRPRAKVEGPLWTLLRMGACQLVLFDGIPARAAIHETVDLTKRLGRPQWTGFVNGVLRGVDRSRTARTTDTPSATSIPTEHGEFREFGKPVLPHPDEQPSAYLAAAFGLPRWLVERWSERFSFDEIVAMGFWFEASPRPVLRVNRLRTDRKSLLAAFAEAGLAAEPGNRDESVRLGQRVSIDALPGFAEGWFQVQDESAMAAAELLDPRPGECILDLCSAPGTKATHLAERMGDEGTVVATDVDDARLARVRENAARLGTSIVRTAVVADDPDSIPKPDFRPGYDAALVDVPCSNTGVLGKRPEVRGRLSPDDLVELPAKQARLLLAAIDRVVPGGRVLYSTCSIEPEENGDVVARVVAGRRVEVVDERLHRPGDPADGAYQALLAVH